MQFSKISGLIFIFIGTIIIGFPIVMVMFNIIESWEDAIITVIITVPGFILLHFGFKFYDRSYHQWSSEKSLNEVPRDLAMIDVIRVASKLETIINRLFKVVMFVSAILGILSVIFWGIFLDGDTDPSNILTGVIFGVSFVFLIGFMLNLRANGKKLAHYLQPLDDDTLDLSN